MAGPQRNKAVKPDSLSLSLCIFRRLCKESKLRAIRDVNLAVSLIDAAPETLPHSLRAHARRHGFPKNRAGNRGFSANYTDRTEEWLKRVSSYIYSSRDGIKIIHLSGRYSINFLTYELKRNSI